MSAGFFSSDDRTLHASVKRAADHLISAEREFAKTAGTVGSSMVKYAHTEGSRCREIPLRLISGKSAVDPFNHLAGAAPPSFMAFVCFILVLSTCYTLPAIGQTAGQNSPNPSRAMRPMSAGVIGSCGHAPSGSGHGDADYQEVYKSEQSVVCVDRKFWAKEENASAISRFFPYFDAIIVQDKALFPVKTPDAPFAFVITVPSGSGRAGCDLRKVGAGGTFCDTVSGDFFTRIYRDAVSRKSIPGFWGYLFPLHESINLFTGLMSPGWPADWWADHRSPFPNAMDVVLLRSIAAGTNSLDPATKREVASSASLQFRRFADPVNPTGEYDSQVVMFLDLFDRFGGFKGYARAFQYAFGEDRLHWPSVSHVTSSNGDDNHSENLSEYVIAYLHLGFGADQDLTPTFRAAGVGIMDKKIAPYEIDSTRIRAIADAHCSIRAATNAGLNVNKQLRALQSGNFISATARGGSSSSCPAECTFLDNSCVAKFRVEIQ